MSSVQVSTSGRVSAGTTLSSRANFITRPGPRTHTVDRRRARRVETRKLTRITLAGTADRVAACITDFSATGLGIIVRQPMTAGQRFQVGVREGTALTSLHYAVVRCDPCRGCYRVGAVLIEVAATAKRPATTRVQRAVDRLRKATGST